MEAPLPATIRVVAAVIERDGRYLITQRRPAAVLPLLWEFPGGKVEAGETDASALRREVQHRLGVDVEVGQLISFVSHPYEKYVVDLYLYECRLSGSEPHALAVNAFKWVSSADFDQYPFTPADEASMNKLLGVGLPDDDTRSRRGLRPRLRFVRASGPDFVSLASGLCILTHTNRGARQRFVGFPRPFQAAVSSSRC